MGNHYFDVFFEKNHIFCGENGRGRHGSAKGSWVSRPDQKLAHWMDLLGQPLSRKTVFKNFEPEPPAPLN